MAAGAPRTKAGIQKKFYEHFHAQEKALQQEIDHLASASLVDSERTDAIEHCIDSIARLSQEVNDALPNLPAHDQRTYADSVKALKERLDDVRATAQPKPKFSFKSRPKNDSALSLRDAAELDKQKRVQRENEQAAATAEASPRAETSKAEDNEDGDQYPALEDMRAAASIRKPSFSKSESVKLSNHSDLHIILPTSASHAMTSGLLSKLRHCIVDMSVPTTHDRPFAGLSLKSIERSLVICGQVSGAVHVTGLKATVLVVSSHQFRMHECQNCDVYLMCSSKPIVDDCKAVRFAPLPACYARVDVTTENKWDQVEDFKWLRSEPSPNWEVLPESQRVEARTWTELVPGGPDHGLEDILKAVGVD
ncbi:MAG: hypothetical protein Q9162_007661 [Coniocarpon cinnabarinum]